MALRLQPGTPLLRSPCGAPVPTGADADIEAPVFAAHEIDDICQRSHGRHSRSHSSARFSRTAAGSWLSIQRMTVTLSPLGLGLDRVFDHRLVARLVA